MELEKQEQTPEFPITAEQVAEFQRQQAEREHKEDLAFFGQVLAFVKNHGYQIAAVPRLLQDGRIGTTWGVIRDRA